MTYPTIKPDRSERVLYNRADFPAYVRKGQLSAYPNYTAESHWHDDIELILILSGEMHYNINGDIILLKEGEGVFVNARQLHFGFSDNRRDCVFLCVLLHPILLCSSQTVEQSFVNPLLSNEHLSFYHLTDSAPWEQAILSAIREIYAIRNDTVAALKIQRAFLDIWIALCENVISIQKEPRSKNYQLSALKDMLSFIHQQYGSKIYLEDIAASGKMGKTGCCALFKNCLNKTPNEYLTELRLRKAMALLKTTDMTILEISYEVGFSGASYFAETFRKFYHCTPGEYRKQKITHFSSDSSSEM